MRVTIIGAGIIGLAASHALLDRGHHVTLLDPGESKGRPTDGNAGWIAHTDIMPLASPRVWRNLPGWLMDPLGPLTIRPSYLPQLLPWLLRFIAASSPTRIEKSICAIRAINEGALPAWQALLSSLELKSRLHERGLLSVWRSHSSFLKAEEMLLRQRDFGIAVEKLTPRDIAAMEPALHNVEAAILYPEMCHVSDPATIASDLLRRAIERGVEKVSGRAVAIEPRESDIHVYVGSDMQEVISERVVVAAGAWSRGLAGQLGDQIPLDTERGYNATYPRGTFNLSRPIMFEGEGFVTTPLESGDRVGGAVEFAGLDAAPNHARTRAMVQRLKRFLPHLDTDLPVRQWMGFRPSIPDSLPVIGRAWKDERVIYAFGHGHHGLTQAAITSRIVADLIESRRGEINTEPFSPQRFRVSTANFLRIR